MAQLLHPHPQEDLPCFLFLRSDSMIKTTAVSSTKQIIIDERFSIIKFSIFKSSLGTNVFYRFTDFVNLLDSLYGLNSI